MKNRNILTEISSNLSFNINYFKMYFLFKKVIKVTNAQNYYMGFYYLYTLIEFLNILN